MRRPATSTRNVLVSARLAPDMFPFVKQIQLTSDFAKNSMARLAGIDPPKFEDSETTMDELVARVKKTLDYIGTVSGRGARRQRRRATSRSRCATGRSR